MTFAVPVRNNNKSVRVRAGKRKPIRIEIAMSNSAGIFQVGELLRQKIKTSSIAPHVEVSAWIKGETEKKILEFGVKMDF